jgi:hypothetical protein
MPTSNVTGLSTNVPPALKDRATVIKSLRGNESMVVSNKKGKKANSRRNIEKPKYKRDRSIDLFIINPKY